jgi:hypothetical protein
MSPRTRYPDQLHKARNENASLVVMTAGWSILTEKAEKLSVTDTECGMLTLVVRVGDITRKFRWKNLS